jgi:hypothetical protein
MTTTRYLPPCCKPSVTFTGTDSSLMSSVAPAAAHSVVPFWSSIETWYSRTPLHDSLKPLHRTLSRVLVVANSTTSPDTSSTLTTPPLGAEQQSFAPSDDTVRCKPAQFVARTAR